MLTHKKYSLRQIRNFVENEGLGYTIRHYINVEHIEDETLRKWSIQAKDVLNKIWSYLEDNTNP